MAARLLPLSLALLFLSCHGSQAHNPLGSQQSDECRLDQLTALEPTRWVESEAGVTEHWDKNDRQFECAGVAALRRTIQPNGLLLPSFSNAPRLVYIVQGTATAGVVVPGCPEAFQSFQQRDPRAERGQRQRIRDQHQKLHELRQGDMFAVPAGVAYWCFNHGERPLIAVTVHHTSNYANQLDRNRREFMLAGSQQKIRQPFERETGQEESTRDNILSGFDVETLAEAIGVSKDLARKIQGEDDQRGEIVQVKDGLQFVRPERHEEEEQQEGARGTNGLEEAFCTARFRQNIDDPRHADYYTQRGGRITTLNSGKLRVLRSLRLSAQRVVLRKNAMVAPHWNINAHSVVYCTGGRGRVQIVGSRGKTVFDGELQRGQIVVVPQNFAVVKQAGDEGFEWVAFKTSHEAIVSPLVGQTSALRGIPVEVIMQSYRVSREEAFKIKFSREEVAVLEPRGGAQERAGLKSWM